MFGWFWRLLGFDDDRVTAADVREAMRLDPLRHIALLNPERRYRCYHVFDVEELLDQATGVGTARPDHYCRQHYGDYVYGMARYAAAGLDDAARVETQGSDDCAETCRVCLGVVARTGGS